LFVLYISKDVTLSSECFHLSHLVLLLNSHTDSIYRIQLSQRFHISHVTVTAFPYITRNCHNAPFIYQT